MEWLQTIVEAFERDTGMAAPGMGKNEAKYSQKVASWLCRNATRYSLNVKTKAQKDYDEIFLKKHIENYDQINGRLRTPQECMLVAFNEPVSVNFSKKENNKVFDDNQQLIGFAIVDFHECVRIGADISLLNKLVFGDDKTLSENGSFFLCLYFLENEKIEGYDAVIAYQWFYFHTDRLYLFIQHICTDQDKCKYYDTRRLQTGKYSLICHSWYANYFLIDFISRVIDRVNTGGKVVIRNKKSIRNAVKGFIFKNNPSPYYFLDLNKVRYKYDIEDIQYGHGSKHGFIYDVRGHYRIIRINGKKRVMWISPQQRGQGQYIPKIYTNMKAWTIPYYFHIPMQQVTKVRAFEVAFIWLVTVVRKIQEILKKRRK